MKKSPVNFLCITIAAMTAIALCACKNNEEAKDTAMKINKVYIASPFFNEEELKNVEYVEQILDDKGLAYFSPMRSELSESNDGSKEWANAVFELDREEIKKADAVVAIYYGSEGDTGTAWECGFAYSIGKPVILVHAYRDGNSNLMMHCSAYTNVYLDELADFDFDKMPIRAYEGKMF